MGRLGEKVGKGKKEEKDENIGRNLKDRRINEEEEKM